MSVPDDVLDRWAALVVGFGANVQPGQIVAVGGEPGKEAYVRAVATEAYKRGAKFVDAVYFDLHVKRARLLHADADTLEFVPSWYGERLLAIGDQRAARVGLSGPVEPGVMDDVDPARAGRDQTPFLKESAKVVNDRTTNWTIAPAPTEGWASLVHPDLAPADALAKLWDQLLHILRLDEDDPVAAWRARADTLVDAAARMTSRRFDALRYEGPGTDLTVGLLPGSRWQAAAFETVDGLPHMPNIPSEEIFTTPDPERTRGYVKSTKPLVLQDGTVVRDLRVTFEGGRVVSLEAETGGTTLKTITETDPGAARLGEIALVDAAGRIGALDTVFYDTLLDENAASHIALGQGFPFLLEDAARSNTSQIHIDFMIGAPALRVSGVTKDGRQVPVLADGSWKL